MTSDERWAATVLRPYANDPRIAAIDVQNELDTSNSKAIRWAGSMVPYVRGVAGSVALTDPPACRSVTSFVIR